MGTRWYRRRPWRLVRSLACRATGGQAGIRAGNTSFFSSFVDTLPGWIAPIRILLWRWRRRGIFFRQAQRLVNGAIKLWINAASVILRGEIHVDSRVRAVILDTPANILEPEAKLRLGCDRSIG